ncbi:YkvI family membrane protein [Sphingomonas bacterium]|uniref:YkvI family membrane protein n=1 Tax=Sphingomonas bacterium TaxID=1895847 RepID=UPI0015763A03|nr:hypothetical protein [Sphingomonas bacterium]
MRRRGSDWFQRLLLPGFAFKAVVIGGGYATGRELATFFMPAGPRGGVYGMLLATMVWSGVAALTFLFAYRTDARDYRRFFGWLLGPLWPVYEVAYALAMIVILAVFAAAAGAIGQAMFGWPVAVGAVLLVLAIAAVAALGNEGVERLFKWVTLFLYGTYALFVVLMLSRFGDRVAAAFAAPAPVSASTGGWAAGGLTYAGYNIIGAIVILPVTRHLSSPRDAVVAGLLAGPFAMLPALLFFVCMTAFYPVIQAQTLPSDYMLARLDLPLFRAIFQAMIFAALLESGTGGVHAVNERIAAAWGDRRAAALSRGGRLAITVAVLVFCVFIAGEFGLAALIGQGFKWLSYTFLAIYVLPLVTIGLWRMVRWPSRTEAAPVR